MHHKDGKEKEPIKESKKPKEEKMQFGSGSLIESKLMKAKPLSIGNINHLFPNKTLPISPIFQTKNTIF